MTEPGWYEIYNGKSLELTAQNFYCLSAVSSPLDPWRVFKVNTANVLLFVIASFHFPPEGEENDFMLRQELKKLKLLEIGTVKS